MSIIVTQINKDGIVFGADSNITTNKEVFREDKKIFEIPKLNAALCVAGSYTINGIFISKWMPNFIEENESNYELLSDFVKLLAGELTNSMLVEEKEQLLILHIAGYQEDHAEMWCLSNTSLEGDGNYSKGREVFEYTEDFWNRDYKEHNLGQVFQSDSLNFQMYVNSLKQGRVAFNTVIGYLHFFFKSLWDNNDFNFRPPKDIQEHEHIVRLYIETIITAYIVSDYNPKSIGGKPQLYIIKAPIT